MKTSCENKNESEINGITNDINKPFLKKEWKDTGKTWKRNCPKCKCVLFYKSYKGLKKSMILNSLCKKCGGIKCINTRKERNNLFGHFKSEECKIKLSNLHSGVKNPFYGKTHTKKNIEFFKKHSSSIIRNEEWCNNIAKSLRKYRLGFSNQCNFNKTACKYFEVLEKQNGWDGFFATKNGEKRIMDLGYSLDYYEPKLNVVIEYDEPKHYNRNGELKSKDIKRMQNIKKYLQCRFFRYNEKIKELKEY